MHSCRNGIASCRTISKSSGRSCRNSMKKFSPWRSPSLYEFEGLVSPKSAWKYLFICKCALVPWFAYLYFTHIYLFIMIIIIFWIWFFPKPHLSKKICIVNSVYQICGNFFTDESSFLYIKISDWLKYILLQYRHI